MRKFKIFQNFINFGKKYRKIEQKYHEDALRNRAVIDFITHILFVATPVFALWGAFRLPTDNSGALAFKILCIALTLIIFKGPADFIVFGIVALRHNLRMKIENKITDVVENNIPKPENSNPNTDVVVETTNVTMEDDREVRSKKDKFFGIIAIVYSILAIIAFIVLGIYFFSTL